ncbi:YopX family protein [Halocola ammonii]
MNTYRLRSEKQIVGYERIEGKSKFYSKDYFWWNGSPIQHDLRDQFSGFKDKNNRPIFENDIVKVRFQNPFKKDRQFRIRSLNQTLELIELDSEKKEPLELLGKAKSVAFVSFTFINTEYIFNTSQS